MSKLFDFKDIRNKPSRNGFDLSNKMAFTAKVGELLPVYWKFTLPGDKFNLKTQHFTRTAPVQSAAFTRMREYFDWFFVPLRLLCKSAPQILTQMTENPVMSISPVENLTITDSLPSLTLNELFGTSGERSALVYLAREVNPMGFNRGSSFLKLSSYLGYGQYNDNILSIVSDSNPTATISSAYSNKNPFRLSVPVSLFPFAAYQKIYQDYYRNTQWENSNPYCWNMDYFPSTAFTLPDSDDYWDDYTMFDLRYCNYNKDLFMGLLPESQLGDVATAPVDVTIPQLGALGQLSFPNGINLNLDLPDVAVVAPTNGLAGTSNGVLVRHNTNGDLQNSQDDLGSDSAGRLNSGPDLVYLDPNGTLRTSSQSISTNAKTSDYFTISSTTNQRNVEGQLSILQLRQAEFLQRWKEIAQCGNQDYRDQIYRHFGVKLPATLGNMCQYVGGSVSQLDINEVVNQAFTEDPDSLANIKGKGVGVGESYDEFSTDEYGVLMCIYHCVPLLDYAISGVDKQLLKTSAYDFAIPEFDKIGFEELDLVTLSNSSDVDIKTPSDGLLTIGYTPRYIDWKTSYDRVVGDFVQSEQMKTWVAPVNDEYLSKYFESTFGQYYINYNFFKVNPSVVNPLFYSEADSTVATDCLMVNSYFDVKAVRNLDYNGLPY